MGLMQRVKAQFGKPSGFWGHVAGRIMASRSSNLERNRWTISLLDLGPEDRVLEIGFGPGVAIREVSRIVERGRVVGIDHSEVMVRQARRRNATGVEEGRVDLRLGSVSDLPEESERYDKVFAVNSMMFWEEPVERLRDLRRLLTPGGIIAITHQPRSRGATNALAMKAGQRLAAHLAEAGFSQVRLEVKKMKPVAAVCAIGVKATGQPPSSPAS